MNPNARVRLLYCYDPPSLLVFILALGKGSCIRPPSFPFGPAYSWRILRASRSAWLFAGMLVLLVTLTGRGRGGSPRSRSAAEWQEVLSATAAAQHAKSQEIGTLLQKTLWKDTPIWPVDTFLRAELYRLRGTNVEARKAYGALTEWSGQAPLQEWLARRRRSGDRALAMD